MTLIDARAPIAALYDRLAIETGLPVDGAAMVAELGPPVETRLAAFGFAEPEIARLATLYRERYPVVVPQTVALPGAAEAITAVHEAGARVIVVTGKATANARLHIDELGWPVDDVVGDLFGERKATALDEFGAGAYVGDHVADMHGAAAAGALAVGVATGPCSAAQLRAAGADVVLDSLCEFPARYGGCAS